jgi:hypothetical protein
MRNEPPSNEHDVASGAIAQTEMAAAAQDGPGALAHPRNAGKWALGVAEKIGVGVAAGATKTALGL